MRKVVGISQKIKRAWLDAVLDRLSRTTDKAELRTFLDEHLKDELPGKESRAKSSGIVLRIWSDIPAERIDLRNRAVSVLSRISGQERIWLHWGMTALAYPFFRDTAEVVGRLLALQDDFTTAQVQNRMLTTWGDRATSRDAVQKLITALVDWGVLRSTKTKGCFLLVAKMSASIPDLQLWLLEALLRASAADEIEAQQLLRLPESFPFKLSVGVADLRRHERFNIHRQGLDIDMVGLRNVKLAPPPKPTKKKAKKEKISQTDQVGLFDIASGEAVSNDGKPNAVPMVPITMQAVEDHRGGVNAVPPGWGSDELSKFWDAARQNQFGTFAKKQPLYKRLSDIDAMFVRVSNNWLNPPDEIAAMLLLRCHSAFRTAGGLAAAGQAAETYVMNRAVLEYAAYALHLHRNAAVRLIWLNRHQSTAELKAARDALTHVKVLATVTAVNQHAAKRFEELYQRTIDFGGHPNERSVTGNMKMVDEPDRRVMLMIMQHSDGPELDMALKTTAQCGMCALEMLQGAFNARFELLGINADMLVLRKGL
jgi:hypothetical protein